MYDVALSFAGEDREYIQKFARELENFDIKYFLDEEAKSELWGRDLVSYFNNLYMNDTKYVIPFISQNYKEKVWCRLERRAAVAKALNSRHEYILPARFDDAIIEEILPTIGYIDLRNRSPKELAIILCKKLEIDYKKIKADRVPPLLLPKSSGKATFNYSNNNGVFIIGCDGYLFETRWSSASNSSIHCYNEPESIKGIALVPKNTNLHEITQASCYDFSSRIRTPDKGQFVILENFYGFFAAVKIVDIEYSAHELTFEFWILTDGSENFSNFRD